jgi:hypothetical protein
VTDPGPVSRSALAALLAAVQECERANSAAPRTAVRGWIDDWLAHVHDDLTGYLTGRDDGPVSRPPAIRPGIMLDTGAAAVPADEAAQRLLEIIDVLWVAMPAPEVLELAGSQPEIVNACRSIHAALERPPAPPAIAPE